MSHLVLAALPELAGICNEYHQVISMSSEADIPPQAALVQILRFPVSSALSIQSGLVDDSAVLLART